MESLFSVDAIFTLFMLVLLQAVLGFDNLLYISIESKRVTPDRQQFVRRLGIGLAIFLRIFLLFAVTHAIQYFQEPFFGFSLTGILEGSFNVHAFIVMIGGIFIIYTAVKEITHMLIIDDLSHGQETSSRSVASALFWIVAMNLIFSFDSLLSAMALTDDFWIMAIAIILSGIMMMMLADTVSEFGS